MTQARTIRISNIFYWTFRSQTVTSYSNLKVSPADPGSSEVSETHTPKQMEMSLLISDGLFVTMEDLTPAKSTPNFLGITVQTVVAFLTYVAMTRLSICRNGLGLIKRCIPLACALEGSLHYAYFRASYSLRQTLFGANIS